MSTCAGCARQLERSFRENSPGRALPVTRYLADDPHARFSVWEDGVARAAVSIADDEAARLADFLLETQPMEKVFGD